MRTNLEARLNSLVQEGKLTEAQKLELLAKHDEMTTSHEGIINHRKDMQAWADENGIDLSLLMPADGSGFGQKRGAMQMMH